MSHSSLDKPFVERLARDLRTKQGIDAWLDEWEIIPGDRIPAKLEEGLSNASVLILVLSPKSYESEWVNYERDAWLTAQINDEVSAKQESRTPKRRLIPVLYENCQKPFFIQSILHVSINERNYNEGFLLLVKGIRGESGKPHLKIPEDVSHSDEELYSSKFDPKRDDPVGSDLPKKPDSFSASLQAIIDTNIILLDYKSRHILDLTNFIMGPVILELQINDEKIIKKRVHLGKHELSTLFICKKFNRARRADITVDIKLSTVQYFLKLDGEKYEFFRRY